MELDTEWVGRQWSSNVWDPIADIDEAMATGAADVYVEMKSRDHDALALAQSPGSGDGERCAWCLHEGRGDVPAVAGCDHINGRYEIEHLCTECFEWLSRLGTKMESRD